MAPWLDAGEEQLARPLNMVSIRSARRCVPARAVVVSRRAAERLWTVPSNATSGLRQLSES